MRRSSAFTLVELLCVILVIGIISAVGLANFVAAQDRANAAGVRENMHTTQIAVEGYHCETTLYADSLVALDPFFPNGSFRVGGQAGTHGTNPFTHTHNDTLYVESFADIPAISAGRLAAPTTGAGGPGQVGYCVTGDGESYAVCGLDRQAKRMANGHGGQLILSNQ